MRRKMIILGVLALGLTACTWIERPATPRDHERRNELRVVALNQLHGIFCPSETDACDAPSRVELLFRQLEEVGCPQIVGLAEISTRQVELIPPRLSSLCDGRYRLVYDPRDGPVIDEEMVLTSLDVLDHGYVDLAGFPWSGLWVKVASPVGVADFIVVHQASSSNNPPCTPESCPPICPVGEETGTCHTRQLIAFMDAHATPGGVQIISGDLNKPPSDPRITPYYDAGFVDSWTEARNGECDPVTGEGCTCCINSDVEDYDGGGLGDPTLTRRSRVDFVLVRNTTDCRLRFGRDTGIFAGPPTAEPVNGVYWPSDHAGVLAEVRLYGRCEAARLE